MKETDLRLVMACQHLAKITVALTNDVIHLNKVVEDYLQADQEQEEKIAELEDQIRTHTEMKLERSLGG